MTLATIVRLLGRERAWRLGRHLYMAARGEIGNAIATNGEAELVRRCLDAFVANGGQTPFVAFDVGANLGEWSEMAMAAAAARGVKLRAELFEPAPGAIKRLEQGTAARPCATLHRQAVSSAPGTATLHIVSETGGTNSLEPNDDPGVTSLAVPVTTIDAVREALGLETIHLIKIDAEGHDLEVLKGLSGALADRAIWAVQFEYSARWLGRDASLRQVFALIEGTGYLLGRIAPEGIELVPSWNGEIDRFFEKNYVLLRDDLVDAVGARRFVWNDSNVLAPA